LSGGLKFSIHLLREIRHINPDILHSSLTYLFENLRNGTPQALYGISKTFFVADQSINDARAFLTEIIEDGKQDQKTREVSLKLLMTIGVLRANVEDYVLAINLMEKHGLAFDISEEIGRVSFDIEESALNPLLFEEIEKIKQDGNIFYLQKLYEGKVLRKNVGFTTDGEFFYLHIKGQGLMKIGTGEADQMIGKVYAHKESYRTNEKCKLLYMNGKLLVRSSKEKDRPLFIVDPATLEEKREFFEVEKDDEITPEWRDDKENNRFMSHTPLITDTNYIYVISHKKPEKGKQISS